MSKIIKYIENVLEANDINACVYRKDKYNIRVGTLNNESKLKKVKSIIDNTSLSCTKNTDNGFYVYVPRGLKEVF